MSSTLPPHDPANPQDQGRSRRADRPTAPAAARASVLAAGLSGLAQAALLGSQSRMDAPTVLRYGVGAWPAVAAAIDAMQ